MTYHYLAFFMGLFASTHCAVMCGPLLIALQGRQQISWTQVYHKLLYQLGRIMTYGVMGLIIGGIGNLPFIQGGQRFISLFTGFFLILLSVLYFMGKKSAVLTRLQTRAVQPFVKFMAKWLYRPAGSVVAGALNGLLPCGMVYLALASALNAAGVLHSFLFMVLFGLGTLPLMLLLAFMPYLTKNIFRSSFAKVLPFAYLLMGIWFLLRGANLDIPYLSPLIHVHGAISCS